MYPMLVDLFEKKKGLHYQCISFYLYILSGFFTHKCRTWRPGKIELSEPIECCLDLKEVLFDQAFNSILHTQLKTCKFDS